MTNKKNQKSYTDYGFGFPVQTIDAPFRRIQGEWALDLNFEKYEKAVPLASTLNYHNSGSL